MFSKRLKMTVFRIVENYDRKNVTYENNLQETPFRETLTLCLALPMFPVPELT